MPRLDLDELEASLGYLKDWHKVLKELRAAREVLEWYADEHNYGWPESCGGPIMEDCGQRAQKYFKGIG